MWEHARYQDTGSEAGRNTWEWAVWAHNTLCKQHLNKHVAHCLEHTGDCRYIEMGRQQVQEGAYYCTVETKGIVKGHETWDITGSWD
jgi:hypothetical protein